MLHMEEVRKWGYEDTHAKSQGISVKMLKEDSSKFLSVHLGASQCFTHKGVCMPSKMEVSLSKLTDY